MNAQFNGITDHIAVGKLESNSSGQYFWLEAHTGAPITSALIELLAGQAA